MSPSTSEVPRVYGNPPQLHHLQIGHPARGKIGTMDSSIRLARSQNANTGFERRHETANSRF